MNINSAKGRGRPRKREAILHPTEVFFSGSSPAGVGQPLLRRALAATCIYKAQEWEGLAWGLPEALAAMSGFLRLLILVGLLPRWA